MLNGTASSRSRSGYPVPLASSLDSEHKGVTGERFAGGRAITGVRADGMLAVLYLQPVARLDALLPTSVALPASALWSLAYVASAVPQAPIRLRQPREQLLATTQMERPVTVQTWAPSHAFSAVPQIGGMGRPLAPSLHHIRLIDRSAVHLVPVGHASVAAAAQLPAAQLHALGQQRINEVQALRAVPTLAPGLAGYTEATERAERLTVLLQQLPDLRASTFSRMLKRVWSEHAGGAELLLRQAVLGTLIHWATPYERQCYWLLTILPIARPFDPARPHLDWVLRAAVARALAKGMDPGHEELLWLLHHMTADHSLPQNALLCAEMGRARGVALQAFGDGQDLQYVWDATCNPATLDQRIKPMQLALRASLQTTIVHRFPSDHCRKLLDLRRPAEPLTRAKMDDHLSLHTPAIRALIGQMPSADVRALVASVSAGTIHGSGNRKNLGKLVRHAILSSADEVLRQRGERDHGDQQSALVASPTGTAGAMSTPQLGEPVLLVARPHSQFTRLDQEGKPAS